MSIHSRLKTYRDRAANPRYKSTDWRDLRWEKHHIPDRPSYSVNRREMYLYSISIGQECGKASDLVRLDHTGYYVDGHRQDTLWGEVVRLRTSKGVLYIPVTVSDAWEVVTYYMGDAFLVPRGSDESDHEDATRDAARMADECARIEAEHAREDWEKLEAIDLTEEARAEIHELNREALAIIREAKGQTFPPAICQAVRDRIKSILAERRELFERIDTLANEPWRIVNNY